MKITKDNIKEITYYSGTKRSVDSCASLLGYLLSDLDELNQTFENTDKHLSLHYEDVHTEYSPERTDPCPDYYGLFSLRFDDEPYETVGDFVTIDELDTVLCCLYDFANGLHS